MFYIHVIKSSNHKRKKFLLFLEQNISTIPDERMKKLIRWREERNRKKKMESNMKKPAFKVGIVHHSLCSPLIRSSVSIEASKTPKKSKEQSNHIQKRITRATEKRLLAKAAAAKQERIKNPTSMSIKNPMSVKTPKTPTSNIRKKKSFAPDDYCFKPPPGLQKIPLFGLVPMKQAPQETPILSQTFDDAIKNFKISTSPRLSLNKQNSSQKLNETIRNSDKLNAIKRTRSSWKEQTKNQTDVQNSLKETLISSDTKTPPSQKSISEKENCSMEDLIEFSPYLVRSRGKKNSRKERQQRLGIGRPSDEIPMKDTVMENLNICVEEEERTAQYFKFLLNKETDRLQELCKKWLDIGLNKDIPEDATYEIQQAVGQTNLLINKKFERFRKLVSDCETGKGEMLVTCRDLQGFWDMSYMEVENCDMRFEKLEQRQNRGWQEEEYTVIKPVVKKRMPIKKQIASSKPSSLRLLILAARKNKAGTLSKEDLLLQDVNEKPNNRNSSIVSLENNDTRRSVRRSKSHDLNENKDTSAQRESSKANSVQFFDKSKTMRSPFAVMKISRMCKTPEVQLDDTVSYVNSDQTPGKSILKKSEELENKEARMKSAHKVNFDDQVVLKNVSVNDETQNKLNLSIALHKIDNLEEINQSPAIHAEKRLNFENEDTDSTDELNELIKFETQSKKRNKSRSSIQNLDNLVHSPDNITSVIFKESSPNNMEIVSPRKNLRNRVQNKNISNKKNVDIFSSPTEKNKDDEMAISPEIFSKDMENLDSPIKVLRNRTVLVNTPKSSRISKMVSYDVF